MSQKNQISTDLFGSGTAEDITSESVVVSDIEPSTIATSTTTTSTATASTTSTPTTESSDAHPETIFSVTDSSAASSTTNSVTTASAPATSATASTTESSDASLNSASRVVQDQQLEKINIYKINAFQALSRFDRFVEGTADDVLLVISSSQLSDRARVAIKSSAERLGYGSALISWATVLDREVEDEPVPIAPKDLLLLVEALDPEAVIITDVGAMSVFSEAYGIGLDADAANRVMCRTCVAFSDFDSMLEDDESKQKAWRVLKDLTLTL